MKAYHKILGMAIIAMLCLNFLGSIASRAFDFNYGYLAVVSFIIYALVGFLVTKEKNLTTGVLLAGVVGFTESILGSLVSKVFREPNVGVLQIEMNTSLWILTIISVTITAILIGLISGIVAHKLKQN